MKSMETIEMRRKTAAGIGAEKQRVFFIDNLRIVLIILVVLHHIALVYGAGAPFYYWEPPKSFGAFRTFLVFILFNQAYFMGFFFLLSGYLLPGSFDRKGPGRYFRGRLLRLGIPLLVFVFILNPLSSLGINHVPDGAAGALAPLAWSLYPKLIGTGPLWFAEMLLLFEFGYTLYRLLSAKLKRNNQKRRRPERSVRQPDKRRAYYGVLLFALGLAGAGYLLRMVTPMGYTVPFLQFPTFAYFPQYMSFFIIGIIAYRKNWISKLPDWIGWAGFGAALAASVVLFPLSLSGRMFSLTLNASSSLFTGNGTWQSAVYAAWDAVFSVGMCLGLVTLFRRIWNRQGKLLRTLSGQSYGVYILHVPVIVYAAIFLQGINLPAVPKFFLAAVIIVPLCFAVSWLVRKIPGVSKVV